MSKAHSLLIPIASGTIAAANIAVTLTNGSADVELSSATIPRNYKGNLLKIWDANGVCIQGFVYTDGAGTVQNIVSTKGGTTRNWAQQGAGFDDTTNCRYEIWKVNDVPVVASGTVTPDGTNVTIDTTTANAFAYVGANWSAYQDGKHMLAMYQGGTLKGFAHIKSGAPGGEGLGGEIVDVFVNGTTFPFPTFTQGAGSNFTAVMDTGNYGLVKKVASPTVGTVYKLTCTINKTSGMNPGIAWTTDTLGVGFIFAPLNTGVTGTYYQTADSLPSCIGFYVNDNTNFAVSGFSLKAMTDCHVQGVHLLSTKGGSRGWIINNVNPNAGEITWKILFVGD